MASYPTAIKSFTAKTDNVDDVMAVDVNDLQDEVAAIETTLGLSPHSGAADVVARLDQALGTTGNLDFASATTLTISSGAATPTQNWHLIDTESSGATDDLDTLTATNATDGFVLFLRQTNAGRVVTIKHNTGNIKCPGAVDIVLSNMIAVMLIYDDTIDYWIALDTPNAGLTNKAQTWTGAQTFSAEVITNAAMRQAYLAVSADTTLSASHYMVNVDASGGAKTITLPTAASIAGRVYIIRKSDASANAVTVDGNGAETINGAATYTGLDTQYDAVTIMSDGVGWMILSIYP